MNDSRGRNIRLDSQGNRKLINLVYSSGNTLEEVYGMKAIIVSDLHIGTRYFRAQHFDNFLKSLPKGYDLAFNGDVPIEIDESFDLVHQQTVELIRQESFRREIA